MPLSVRFGGSEGTKSPLAGGGGVPHPPEPRYDTILGREQLMEHQAGLEREEFEYKLSAKQKAEEEKLRDSLDALKRSDDYTPEEKAEGSKLLMNKMLGIEALPHRKEERDFKKNIYTDEKSGKQYYIPEGGGRPFEIGAEDKKQTLSPEVKTKAWIEFVKDATDPETGKTNWDTVNENFNKWLVTMGGMPGKEGTTTAGAGEPQQDYGLGDLGRDTLKIFGIGGGSGKTFDVSDPRNSAGPFRGSGIGVSQEGIQEGMPLSYEEWKRQNDKAMMNTAERDRGVSKRISEEIGRSQYEEYKKGLIGGKPEKFTMTDFGRSKEFEKYPFKLPVEYDWVFKNEDTGQVILKEEHDELPKKEQKKYEKAEMPDVLTFADGTKVSQRPKDNLLAKAYALGEKLKGSMAGEPKVIQTGKMGEVKSRTKGGAEHTQELKELTWYITNYEQAIQNNDFLNITKYDKLLSSYIKKYGTESNTAIAKAKK